MGKCRRKRYIQNLKASYGAQEIIHGITLSIKPGEFCALLGLNGSGKTTLLHACCGFLDMRGVVSVSGQDCTALDEKKRAQLLSFIPQVCGLQGGKTALEVVLMGFNARLGLLESPSAAQKQAALAALDRLGYAEYAQRDFGELSQGQRQVIILARCMVQDTPVMLMDEPDSALDFLNRHTMLGRVRELIKAEGKAGLISLHDPNFAISYCDRLFLLKEGAIAGEINMKTAPMEEIGEKLRRIYGSVELLKYGGGYLMGRIGTEETHGASPMDRALNCVRA